MGPGEAERKGGETKLSKVHLNASSLPPQHPMGGQRSARPSSEGCFRHCFANGTARFAFALQRAKAALFWGQKGNLEDCRKSPDSKE